MDAFTKWAQKPETKAKIDAVKKSAWTKFTKQFPNADKNQFFAQTSVDDEWNVTAECNGLSIFADEKQNSLTNSSSRFHRSGAEPCQNL